MNLKFQIIVLLLFIGFSSCSESPHYFIGKWQIVTAVENNEAIPLVDNWMHLKSDGSFESYDGDLKQKENGTWRYRPQEKILFIDEEGKDAASGWTLSVKSDTLFFHSTANGLYLIGKKI